MVSKRSDNLCLHVIMIFFVQCCVLVPCFALSISHPDSLLHIIIRNIIAPVAQCQSWVDQDSIFCFSTGLTSRSLSLEVHVSRFVLLVRSSRDTRSTTSVSWYLWPWLVEFNRCWVYMCLFHKQSIHHWRQEHFHLCWSFFFTWNIGQAMIVHVICYSAHMLSPGSHVQ